MRRKIKVKGYFKGAEADAREKGIAMSPGTSASGGVRNDAGLPEQPTPNLNVSKKKPKVPKSAPPGATKDAPFKQNILMNALASAVVPGGGLLMGMAQKKAYQDRQKFARKEGLYRDFYRTNQFNPDPFKRTLKPNTKEGKAYLKEAGFGKKTKDNMRDDRGPQLCPDGTLPPCVKPKAAADPAKPKTFQPQKFNFEFSQGGLSGGKRFGPPPKKGPRSHGICPHRPDGIRGVGAVEKGRGVKFVGVK